METCLYNQTKLYAAKKIYINDELWLTFIISAELDYASFMYEKLTQIPALVILWLLLSPLCAYEILICKPHWNNNIDFHCSGKSTSDCAQWSSEMGSLRALHVTVPEQSASISECSSQSSKSKYQIWALNSSDPSQFQKRCYLSGPTVFTKLSQKPPLNVTNHYLVRVSKRGSHVFIVVCSKSKAAHGDSWFAPASDFSGQPIFDRSWWLPFNSLNAACMGGGPCFSLLALPK